MKPLLSKRVFSEGAFFLT